MGEYSYVTALYESNVYYIALLVTYFFNVNIYNLLCIYICNRFTLMNLFYLHRVMGSPPSSPPYSDGHSQAVSKRSRQST